MPTTATMEKLEAEPIPVHHHYYDFTRNEWQCQECDNCTDYCDGPSAWRDPLDG